MVHGGGPAEEARTERETARTSVGVVESERGSEERGEGGRAGVGSQR
jgi:hypothetical protein